LPNLTPNGVKVRSHIPLLLQSSNLGVVILGIGRLSLASGANYHSLLGRELDAERALVEVGADSWVRLERGVLDVEMEAGLLELVTTGELDALGGGIAVAGDFDVEAREVELWADGAPFEAGCLGYGEVEGDDLFISWG